MSLRWRFTLLVTGLLTAVLVSLGLWIRTSEHALAEDEVVRRLDEWLRRSLPQEMSRLPGRRGPQDAEVVPTPASLPQAPADVPVQIEWFVRDWRVAELAHEMERIDVPPPSEARAGPRPVPSRTERRSHAGRSWFVHVVYVNETYEIQGDRAVRAPGRGPRRGPPRAGDRPRDRDGPRGRGGRRPPRPPRPPDAPDEGPIRPVPLRGRIIADADALFGYVGYDDRIRTLWLTGLAALVVGALFSWIVSGAMVRPIGRAARAAEAIRQLRQRLPEPGSKDELGRLVVVLNEMLGRLEQGAIRERQFLGTASHELRRPLAALTAELELAQRGERSAEDLRAAIDLALGDARNMGRLVDDLLAHARARAGALTVDASDLDLVELVTEAVGRCTRIAGQSARIEIGDLPELVLRADRHAIGRAIENLVLNAATHGGDGVTVTVHAARSARGLALSVEDDGPGIPADDLARIFDAFGRGDTAKSSPGAGLGLAIVRDIVEAHDGSVDVVSPLAGNGEGRGTRFTVVLPAERVVSAA